MALERTKPIHRRRRTRGSSLLTGIGKHGPLASHVSLQCRPSLKRACATAVGTKSTSWSTNWPHCISMWLNVSSDVTRDVDSTRTDTVRALGRRTPLYSRPADQPASTILTIITRYWPGGGETICPRRWQFDGGISFRRQSDHLRQSMDPKIAADPLPSADGSAVRIYLVAGGG